MSRFASAAALACVAALITSSSAMAHIGISSGPAFVGERQVITFSVGHGCEGADTLSVEVGIPSEITSVRGVPNTFGPADVITDDADVVTAVRWAKDSVRDADDQYYQLQIRITVPETPFQTLYFPATQVCRDAEGNETTVEWAALPGDEPDEGEEEAPPAASLLVLPPRMSGWNQYTVEDEVEDLSIFDDALIVWSGDAAYSSNPHTADLIEAEDDVDTLESIDAGAEIWVKY